MSSAPSARRRLALFDEPSRRSRFDVLPPVPGDFTPQPLQDSQGRVYRYVRFSLTDHCDMACVYCMPQGGELEHGLRPELLTEEEILRLARIMQPLGVRRVRLTGGEPLLRKGLPSLIRGLRDLGIDDVFLTTNGSRLQALARPLQEAGLRGVNVSIDSLVHARFAEITRGAQLDQVLAGIEEARQAGLVVKTNSVVLRGKNDDELESLVRWAWARSITPRFIELMPLGEGAKLPSAMFVPRTEMQRALAHLLQEGSHIDEGAGPARYWRSLDGAQKVGFITSVSEEFCASCNRFRLTAVGEIRACLASRRALSLRDLMREGSDDRTLAWALHWSLLGKARGHAFTDPEESEHAHVGMSLIGG